LDNQSKALEKRIQERNVIENQRREQEMNFLRTQNENLDKFLKSLETIKNA
jgi:hypothetical protein